MVDSVNHNKDFAVKVDIEKNCREHFFDRQLEHTLLVTHLNVITPFLLLLLTA
jgi:hypothetical protein